MEETYRKLAERLELYWGYEEVVLNIAFKHQDKEMFEEGIKQFTEIRNDLLNALHESEVLVDSLEEDLKETRKLL